LPLLTREGEVTIAKRMSAATGGDEVDHPFADRDKE